MEFSLGVPNPVKTLTIASPEGSHPVPLMVMTPPETTVGDVVVMAGVVAAPHTPTRGHQGNYGIRPLSLLEPAQAVAATTSRRPVARRDATTEPPIQAPR